MVPVVRIGNGVVHVSGEVGCDHRHACQRGRLEMAMS